MGEVVFGETEAGNNWETYFDLVDLVVAEDGSLETAPGEKVGTATSKAPFFADSYVEATELLLEGCEAGIGCSILGRFRSAATSVACESAVWSKWFNILDPDAVVRTNPGLAYLNDEDGEGGDPVGTDGGYWMFEIRLRDE